MISITLIEYDFSSNFHCVFDIMSDSIIVEKRSMIIKIDNVRHCFGNEKIACNNL